MFMSKDSNLSAFFSGEFASVLMISVSVTTTSISTSTGVSIFSSEYSIFFLVFTVIILIDSFIFNNKDDKNRGGIIPPLCYLVLYNTILYKFSYII